MSRCFRSRRSVAMSGLIAAIAIFAGIAVPARAQAIDPHSLYEQRCASCHESHAREFVKNSLKRTDAGLVGAKSAQELSAFLTRHAGTNLSDAEIAALVEHFRSMTDTGWIYEKKCVICHDRAKVLARTMLTERDGQLVGRYTGHVIKDFLRHHGRLDEKEISVIIAMFKRQLATSAN